jgi:hypothetical protein
MTSAASSASQARPLEIESSPSDDVAAPLPARLITGG